MPGISGFHPATEGRKSGAGGGDSGTVLLVEDNSAVLRLASTVLRRTGFHVLAATDGAEALVTSRELREKVREVLAWPT